MPFFPSSSSVEPFSVMGAGPHSSTRANSSVMSGEYYDVNDFLAREHAVTVEFVDGASSLGPEVVGKRTTHISNKPTTPNGDADGDDVPREHVARVPVVAGRGVVSGFAHSGDVHSGGVFGRCVFNKLEAENGAKILDLRSVNESYFGFAACVLSALTIQNDDDEDLLELVGEFRKKIYKAYQKRWREVLCESDGTSERRGRQRLLTREEREVWNAGREAGVREYRYGRGGRVVANKLVIDAKRRKT